MFGGIVPFELAIVFGIFAVFWLLPGLFIIGPREAAVIIKWGKFRGVEDKEGIHFWSPWGRRMIRIATTQNSLEVARTTVVEKNGNPIEISAVVVYHVSDVKKAAIDVASFPSFVRDQTTAVIKRVAATFPYESPDPEVPCLRKESQQVTDKLISELQRVAAPAGVSIDSVRLNDLTYAPEIAQAMLMRQQAQALVDARKTIVDGAVGMVRDCIGRLHEAGLDVSATQREQLVASLLIVLCSSERVQPTLAVSDRPRS